MTRTNEAPDRGDSGRLAAQIEGHGAARGYSWPPFEPGNVKALRHGANSPRQIAEKASEVHAALLEVAPYLSEDKFAPALARYLHAAARETLLHDYIVRLCEEEGVGAVPSRVWEQCTASANLAAKLGQQLGLDPIGHSRLRKLHLTAEAVEATLADLAEQGRSTSGWAALHGPESEKEIG